MSEILSPEDVTARILAVAPRVGTDAPTKAEPTPSTTPPEPSAEITAEKPPTDAIGRAFDPARFRSNPDGTPYRNAKGLFMPRGGRKPKATTPVAPPSPATPPQPIADPWTPEERSAAAAPVAATEAKPEGEQAQSAPPPVGSSADAAEVGCRAVYTLAGLAVGSPEDAVPPAAEHKNYVDTAAKYIDYRGWRFVGGLALALMGIAYVLRLISKPKVEKRLREMFGSGEPVDVSAVPSDAPPSTPPPAAAVPPVIPKVNEPVMFTKPFVPPAP